MIKFFRSIRKNLLSKNETLNYIRYALGEIVLVVIGILIALSINSWNESRKQDIAEQEFIEGIKNDLSQDKDYIMKVIQLAQKKDSVYTIINKDLFNLYDTNRSLLDSLFREYFVTQRTFYPISGSFQSAISGNEISKYKNKKFSAAVTRLYNSTYTRLMDNAISADERWHYLTKKYSKIRRTGHLPDMTKPELDEFLDEMYYHMFGINYYRENLSKAIEEIDYLLDEH